MTLSRTIGLNLHRSFCTYLSYKIRFSLCKQSASTIEINTTVYSDRSLPSQHRVQQNTQTPNITSSIITLPFQHLKSYQSKVRIARQIYSYSTFDKIQYYNCQRDTENTFGIQYICDDATAFYRLPRKTQGVEIVNKRVGAKHMHTRESPGQAARQTGEIYIHTAAGESERSHQPLHRAQCQYILYPLNLSPTTVCTSYKKNSRHFIKQIRLVIKSLQIITTMPFIFQQSFVSLCRFIFKAKSN